MKIIIAGAGEVGYHLAKLLSFESHDITLIDNQKSNLNIAENKLDIKTIEGNSASISVLKDANVAESIMVWGAFIEDEINVSKLGSLQKEAVFLAQEVGYK